MPTSRGSVVGSPGEAMWAAGIAVAVASAAAMVAATSRADRITSGSLGSECLVGA